MTEVHTIEIIRCHRVKDSEHRAFQFYEANGLVVNGWLLLRNRVVRDSEEIRRLRWGAHQGRTGSRVARGLSATEHEQQQKEKCNEEVRCAGFDPHLLMNDDGDKEWKEDKITNDANGRSLTDPLRRWVKGIVRIENKKHIREEKREAARRPESALW